MHPLYYKVFNYLDNSKPTQLGIYFSLFLHLSILLFAIGLPDFFKPKKITIPQIIPIEILNVSDVTSLTPKNKNIEIDANQIKKIKQKKFNSSENTDIKKIDLQEKPKKKVNLNENKNENNINKKPEVLNTPLKENLNNELKKEKKVKVNNVETLKTNKIKPKLKPKFVEKKESQSDLDLDNKIKPVIKKINEKKIIDKLQPMQKPEQDFNIASMLKDLRNEEVSSVSEIDKIDNEVQLNDKEDNQIKPN